MEVLIAEWIRKEENQETSAVISRSRNAGILEKRFVRPQHFYG
jgi:hypothetical protein